MLKINSIPGLKFHAKHLLKKARDGDVEVLNQLNRHIRKPGEKSIEEVLDSLMALMGHPKNEIRRPKPPEKTEIPITKETVRLKHIHKLLVDEHDYKSWQELSESWEKPLCSHTLDLCNQLLQNLSPVLRTMLDPVELITDRIKESSVGYIPRLLKGEEGKGIQGAVLDMRNSDFSALKMTRNVCERLEFWDLLYCVFGDYVDWSYSSFKHSHFYRCHFREVAFVGCDFSGVTFEMGLMYESNFRNTKFIDAKLPDYIRGCNFEGADLRGTGLTYDDLSGSTYDGSTIVD